MECKLIETSCGCPEQYNVVDTSNQMVGYWRLRHGHFTVEVPDCGGKLILSEYPDGDGSFTDEERATYFSKAILAMSSFYEEQIFLTNFYENRENHR